MTYTMAHFNQFIENYNTKLPAIVARAALRVIKTIKELSLEKRRKILIADGNWDQAKCLLS